MRGVTVRTSVGAPGGPPAADTYSGTPTHVKSNPSRGLAEQFVDLAIEERHAGGARTQAVGSQMQPALDDPGRELCLSVLAIAECAHVGCADHDERGLGRQALVEAYPVELVA